MGTSSGRKTTKRDLWLVAALVIVAGVLIGYVALQPAERTDGAPGEPSRSGQASPPATQASPLDEIVRRVPGDPYAIGEPDAPVTLIAYSDYRCPFCAKFSRDTEPVLVDRYVADGTLRIEMRDFPIFGEQSLNAARAGRAAAAQGMFWEFSRAVYAAAPQTGHADLSPEVLRGFAADVGVPDLDRFAADLRGTAFDEDIQADLTEGQTIGVPSTPVFVINGKPILGAQPLAEFTTAIDEAAARE